ncbi:sugar transporter [Bacteroidia bacterium]|nr:sugar transporter [Bacteroidia bacterium]
MKNLKIGLVFGLMVLFTSCLTTKDTNLLQPPEGNIPSYEQAQEPDEYRIKPGDELKVQIRAINVKTAALYSIFAGGSTDGNKLYSLAVSPEGVIYFPYVGDIQVAGKTILDVQQEIENRITRTILSKDACLVYVSLANRSFSVIGESSVGRYPIVKEKLTIYQALSQSGDISTYGNRTNVKIIRQTQDGTIVRTFDIRSKTIVNSEFYYVQPNDVIYIEPMSRQFMGLNSFASIMALITGLASIASLIFVLSRKV